MTNPSNRMQRIEAQIQRSLAGMLPRLVKDPRAAHVTITHVRMTADKGTALIYFLPFGTNGGAEEAAAGLRSAGKFLRGELARALKLRYAPRLEFILDTNLERAGHLSALIDTAVREDRARAGTDVEPH